MVGISYFTSIWNILYWYVSEIINYLIGYPENPQKTYSELSTNCHCHSYALCINRCIETCHLTTLWEYHEQYQYLWKQFNSSFRLLTWFGWKKVWLKKSRISAAFLGIMPHDKNLLTFANPRLGNGLRKGKKLNDNLHQACVTFNKRHSQKSLVNKQGLVSRMIPVGTLF